MPRILQLTNAMPTLDFFDLKILPYQRAYYKKKKKKRETHFYGRAIIAFPIFMIPPSVLFYDFFDFFLFFSYLSWILFYFFYNCIHVHVFVI